MATVELNWTNPTDTTEITGYRIYRYKGTNAATTVDITEIEHVDGFIEYVFKYDGELRATITDKNQTSYSDTVEASGTYSYGIFSYNTAGPGPGCSTKVVV